MCVRCMRRQTATRTQSAHCIHVLYNVTSRAVAGLGALCCMASTRKHVLFRLAMVSMCLHVSALRDRTLVFFIFVSAPYKNLVALSGHQTCQLLEKMVAERPIWVPPGQRDTANVEPCLNIQPSDLSYIPACTTKSTRAGCREYSKNSSEIQPDSGLNHSESLPICQTLNIY